MALRLLFVLLVALAGSLAPTQSRAAAPAPPVILGGFPLIAGDNVVIAWSPVPGAASYKVYRDGKLLDGVAGTGYAAPLPASGEDVRFQVSAVSEAGEEGRLSAPGVVRLRRIEPPTEVESSVNRDQPSVFLAWVAVHGALGYNVYRIAEKGNPALVHSGNTPYFRDRSVRKGARYGYAVAAIDRGGREGERSRWHAVEIPAEARLSHAGRKSAAGKTAAGAARPGGKGDGPPSPLDAAFVEVMSIEKVDNVPLGDVSFLGPGIDNVFWVVRPRARRIHAVNRSGEVVSTLMPEALDAAGKGFVPHKLAVASDGRLVVSDARNGAVACFDRDGGLLWSRKVVPPPDSDPVAWKDFPPEVRTLRPCPSSVLILPREILVTDQRLQLIYRLSHAGDPRGHITHYRKGKDTWRLRRVGELESVPGDGVLVTLPLVRKALLVNAEFDVISEIVGSGKDRAVGFLGLHGARNVPGEGVLLTDPTTGRLGMYDPETGEHLRTLRTPAFVNPNMAALGGDGRLWVYLARQKRIAVLARGDQGK